MSIILTHRRLRIGGVLGTLAAVALLGTASAPAAGPTSAICVSRFSVTITPGFGPTRGSGTLTSHGETGSITCIGKIGGHRVTGRGSVGLDETYTRGSCLSHVGTGTVRVSLPTSAGVKHMVGAATSRRSGLGLLAEVRFRDARFSGVGVAVPTQGNCLLTPLRRALITVSGSLNATSAAAAPPAGLSPGAAAPSSRPRIWTLAVRVGSSRAPEWGERPEQAA